MWVSRLVLSAQEHFPGSPRLFSLLKDRHMDTLMPVNQSPEAEFPELGTPSTPH